MLAKFFARRRTIDSITAPITNIVSKLQTHAELHTEAAQTHEIRAAVHADLAGAAKAEVTAANEAAAKFSKLFA